MIEVTGCKDCPFYEYIGEGCNADRGFCHLAAHENLQKRYIDNVPDNFAVPVEPPDWCPLPDGELAIAKRF